jgi:hypothetical protein
MGRQVYFVVAVDVDEKTVAIDDGTFTAKFDSSEQVWNEDTNEWQSDPELVLYNAALELLNNTPLSKE